MSADDDTSPQDTGADDAGAPDEELDRLREENARLRAEVDHDLEAQDDRRRRRRRGFTAIALLVVGSILLPISVLTIWTRNQLLDTDRYVETVAPLAKDPTIQSAMTARISAKVAELLDVKSLAEEALPERAAFLAVPIAAGANNLIDTATKRVIESERFESAWVKSNEIGHDALVAVLTGRDGKIVSLQDGKVVVKLGAVVKEVLDRVDDQFGIDVASKVPADKLNVDFVIVDSDQLADVQVAVRWLDRLAWLSVILAVCFLVGSVAVAVDRRKGLLRVGVGIALGMLVLYLGFTLGRDLYLTNLPSGVERPDAAAAVFDTLTRFVLQAVRTIFVLGVVLMVGAWVAGPSSAARTMRGFWDRVLGRGGNLAGSAVDLGPVPAWVSSHLVAVRAAIVALAVVVLIAWDRPTGRVVLWIALATLIPLALVQLIANAGRDASSDDVDGPGPAGALGPGVDGAPTSS
jgi:hypothetical protein